MQHRLGSVPVRLGSWLVLSSLFSCGTPQKTAPSAASAGTEARASTVLRDAPPGLTVRLSEGAPPDLASPRVPIAPATKLSEREAAQLLARLPKLRADPSDEKEFALRDRSAPPPRTGTTERQAFPPREPAESAPRPSATLEVIRFSPAGEVPIAPHLSVTFDQPMVALTSHDDAVASGVPVRIEPMPPGRFRWVGTKTLLFDPDVRFPMATEYTVTVSAGTRSATGATLEREVRFELATPAPRLVARHPVDETHRRDPLIFLGFDQRIDPARVAETVSLVVKKRRFSVRVAREDEIEADATVFARVKSAKDGPNHDRFVVVTPTEPLPGGSRVEVRVGPHTPSAEGPRKTLEAQTFSFSTYGPLTVLEHRCGWGRECRPGEPFQIRFSNPLDAESAGALVVTASPAIPRLRTSASGDWLTIQGATRGRTRYEVTIPTELKDRFGQSLAEPVTLKLEVGDASPTFFGPSGVVISDPTSKRPSYDVHTVNVPSLDVEIYRVSLADWPAFVALMNENHRKPVPRPGTRVVKRTIRVAGSPDAMTETSVDLAEALSGGLGHAVVLIEPTRWSSEYKPKVRAWVQVTRVGVDAFVDGDELVAWGTELATGKPIEGLDVRLEPERQTAVTDARGLATLALPASASGARSMVVARRGDDLAFLPHNPHYPSEHGGWAKRADARQLVWHVFDDRQMYRPSETVHVKGWVREVDFGEGGDVSLLRDGGDQLSWTLVGPRGNELRRGTTKLNALGGFDLAFDLPSTPNLGHARVDLRIAGRRDHAHSHYFQIQEFRRPEFEVRATVSGGPHTIGRDADVVAEARYYAGGGLASAPVHWQVTSRETSFTPPNRDDYSFGRFKPWWVHRADEEPPRTETLRGETDASGKHALHLDFVAANPPLPMSVVAEATIHDVNRQAWASQSVLLVHPSDLYVGLKRERYFVEKGKPIELDVIVVDHDGKSVVGREAVVEATRVEYQYRNGTFSEIETDRQRCVAESEADATKCRFETPEGGTYKVKATVLDDRGRPSLTELTVWVTGGPMPPKRNLEQEEVTLVPNKRRFAPGEQAELLVQAPFFPAEGLLTMRRGGIVSTSRFTLDGPSTTVKVDVRETHFPSVIVQVDLVGTAPRIGDDGESLAGAPRRPAYAKGTITLPVPPVARELSVKATPAVSKLEPGGETELAIEVTNHRGEPVKDAEVAVVVVDEAVLALSGYVTPNPLPVFHPERGSGVSDHHARAILQLANPDAMQAQTSAGLGLQGTGAGGGGMMRDAAAPRAYAMEEAEGAGVASLLDLAVKSRGPGQAPSPILVRKDFDALAVFEPEARTDASGKTKLRVKVPDNLTRYRIMAVAVAGEKLYGAGESSLTARMPIMVRPSAPRFLNFGDVLELPVVIQNQTDRDLDVDVAMRTANMALSDGSGRRVKVRANHRVEVRFPARAERPGAARFQVAASAGRFSDAAEGSLPVYTPATTEAFATYGELDAGATTQPVAMPRGVIEAFGGLEVTTSSTQLQALTDAVLYLVAYPFECAEQVASRVLAIAALRDVLDAFQVEGMPSKAELEATVKRDLERLRGLQNDDGGFSFWERGRESWPWITVHVTSALVRAKAKGFDVPEPMLKRALGYTASVERHIPGYYSAFVRRSIEAYALYTRAKAGQVDAEKARSLLTRAGHEGLGLEALGFLLGTLSADASSKKEAAGIVRFLTNRVSETAGAANFTTSHDDGAHLILASSRRADGVILEALITAEPSSDLIPKLVRGLLAHRVRGRWGNTQENTFVLLALDAYFQAFERVTPKFVAKLWLGDAFAGAQPFRGRSTSTNVFDVPMSYVARNRVDITLAKEGTGRLYYRIGMTYAPENLELAAADHGFSVERRYEAVDDPGDVVRQADGTWKIKAGATVRVRLTMVAENRRYHAALVDPLPAGLEPLNPALKVTGSIPQDPNAQKQAPFWWWRGTWYEHQNMRDERVEAFASLLPAGVHEYVYVARATTPGRFVVPPAKAEEMYMPETFGRSASDVVVVE
jgi:alpha-2-macroglobulin